MEATDVVETYVDALEAGDREALVGLFAPGASVTSPLREDVTAREFYADLMTTHSAPGSPSSRCSRGTDQWRPQLSYDWTLADGTRSVFDCVDVFRFDDAGRIASLRIFYDPADVREAYEAVRPEG